MKIAVLSGRYPISGFSSSPNHKAYCLKHGYTYIHANWPTGSKNPYMNKMEYIKEYYNLFDYIFWIDDDAFFINLDTPLESFIPLGNEFFVACKSPDNKSIHTYLSSGQFLLRCNKLGRDFINDVSRTDLKKVQNWWFESTVDLGFFSNGDQDAMIYLLLKNDKYKEGAVLHNYKKFNCRLQDLYDLSECNIFILHFTGVIKRKKKDYRSAQKYLNKGAELLDKKTALDLGVIQRRSILKRVLFKLINIISRYFKN